MFRCHGVAARRQTTGSVRCISAAATAAALLPTRPLLLPGRRTPLARAPPPPSEFHDAAGSTGGEAADHWPHHTHPAPPPCHPRSQRGQEADRNRGSAAPYPVSVMPGDTVAQQATAAFRALFGQPHASPASGATAAGGAVPASAAPPHESAGEEEVLENRHVYADDAVQEEVGEADPVASPASPTSASALPADLPHARRALLKDAAAAAAASWPVTLFGSHYGEAMAVQLNEAAARLGFASPFWSSRGAFEALAATVTVPDAEGVLLSMTLTTPTLVFNLEQTTLARQYREAPMSEVIAELRRRRRGGSGADRWRSGRSEQVLSLCGSAIASHRAHLIAASPHFGRLQAASPRWASTYELAAVGAAIKPAELDSFVEVPQYRGRYHADPQAVDEDGGGAKEEDCVRMYNVSQLEDQPRFGWLDAAQHAVARCYGSRGSRYSNATTWVMWEYCARYHFPVSGVPRIVFLTAEKVAMMGGDIVNSKRYPHMAAERAAAGGALPSTGDDGTAGQGGAQTGRGAVPVPTGAAPSSRALGVGNTDCGEGVVPPPFAIVVRDEVVTLYNALQTNIPDVIHRHVDDLQPRYAKWMLQK